MTARSSIVSIDGGDIDGSGFLAMAQPPVNLLPLGRVLRCRRSAFQPLVSCPSLPLARLPAVGSLLSLPSVSLSTQIVLAAFVSSYRVLVYTTSCTTWVATSTATRVFF
jgi:hypothetical protein